MVKQEMARVNINILGISELNWTGMGEFNSDNHYIYYCGQQSLRGNGVALIVNERVWNAVLGCSLKNDRMISVHFQGKPFNSTVIQVYTPTTKAKEAKVVCSMKLYKTFWASLVVQMVKNLLQCRRSRFYPWAGKISWRRDWLPTSVVLPGEFHG